MKLVIESRKIMRERTMIEDGVECFQCIIEDRESPRFEKVIDGYSGFLFHIKVAILWWRCIGNTVSIV